MRTIDYSERLLNLKNRRTDKEIISNSIEKFSQYNYLNESYEQIDVSDTYKYIVGAMASVDDIYTKNTYKEGERIKNQLDKIKSSELGFEYRYQGSVTNNTHIKAHSDIDILVIIDKFYTLENPQKASFPYRGNPIADLSELRLKCFKHLTVAFPEAKVDDKGAKSISLEGGSLRRKIDVVPANWFNTNDYKETLDETHRGIQILDYKKQTRYLNTPFKHNKLIEIKDKSTNGKFKKCVRLLKTIKVDSELSINLSSYDITALMYNMDLSYYRFGSNEIILLKNMKIYLENILKDKEAIEILEVPDGSRKIFDDDKKIDGLTKLAQELDGIYRDLENEIISEKLDIQSKGFAI